MHKTLIISVLLASLHKSHLLVSNVLIISKIQ